MKFILTILTLFFLKADAQPYVASWTGQGFSKYEIQQAIDTNNWNTIGTIAGKSSIYNYTFNVPGPTFFYRIKADQYCTKPILISEVLSIKNPSKGKKSRIEKLTVKVSVESEIHYTIESPQPQQMQYSLYDMSGRRLSEKTINLQTGTNTFSDKKPNTGIYYGQFVGYFDCVTTKIINQ